MFTGVGTAIIMNFALERSLSSEVNLTLVFFISSSPTSFVGSIPDLYTSIFSLFRSKPVTSIPFFEKACAMGIPTYPRPTTASVSSLFTSLLYSSTFLFSPILPEDFFCKCEYFFDKYHG